jgi:hypothetical protein
METTDYGSWNLLVTGTSHTVEDFINGALGEYANDYDLISVYREFRDAINASLPADVELCGNTFYGPWPVPVGIGDTINAAVDGVDFWEIVDRHRKR